MQQLLKLNKKTQFVIKDCLATIFSSYVINNGYIYVNHHAKVLGMPYIHGSTRLAATCFV